MASSSSAHKVAKLASKNKGKKVRFQGGTLFPVVMGVIGLLLVGLIVYAKSSLPNDGGGPPRLGDHWHGAYASYVCRDGGSFETLPNLKGTLEEQGIDPTTGEQVVLNAKFRNTGIHSHQDGVMHWHPYTSRATGRRARFGVFLDNYGVTLTNSKLAFPTDQGGETFDTATYTCDGKATKIVVRVWDNYASDKFTDCTKDCKNLRVDKNGMVFVIAVVPKEGTTDIPKPVWAEDLPTLGASDGGDPIPTEGSGPANTVPVITVPGGSAPAGSAPVATAPQGTTAPGGATAPSGAATGTSS